MGEKQVILHQTVRKPEGPDGSVSRTENDAVPFQLHRPKNAEGSIRERSPIPGVLLPTIRKTLSSPEKPLSPPFEGPLTVTGRALRETSDSPPTN